MFIKIALRNVRRQMGNYLIYFVTVMLTVALMFSINNVTYSEKLDIMETMQGVLRALSVGVAFVVALILGYATSFMIKLRKREFGTYLTLGMTRKNILCIFLVETAVLGAVAIIAGMVLGLFLYQGMMMLMTKLMEMEFSFAPYSAQGFLFTIILVVIIYLSASVTSAIYLSRVSIYELIHGEKKVEKEVRHSGVWMFVAGVSLVMVIAACILFGKGLWLINDDDPSTKYYMLFGLFMLIVGIVVFHIGISQGLMGIFLKKRKFSSRGGNTFLLRQLSGMLRANAAMMGAIAFLIVLAVIGANYAFVMKNLEQKMLEESYPFDVSASVPAEGTEGPSLEEGMRKIEEYQPVSKILAFDLYTTDKNQIFGNLVKEAYGVERDTFMKESDYNRLMQWKGGEPLQCGSSFYVVENLEFLDNGMFQDKVLEEGGKQYTYAGTIQDSYLENAVIVVPDDVVKEMRVDMECALADLEKGRYDALALSRELSYERSYEWEEGKTTFLVWSDFVLKEKARQERNNVSAILIVGALYLAVVFVFMSMAVLALKTFAGLSEDSRRYEILNRLGAGKEEQKRILFRQTYLFFFVPFCMPLLFSIPTAALCAELTELVGYAGLTGQVYQNAGWFAVMLTAVYVLYFTATYLISKRNTLTL